MPATLLLNPPTWDLLVDDGGNIAVASEPYALAQDAASSIRLFQGEAYYNTVDGIPYWQQILGHWPSPSLMKAHFIAAAEEVPNVASAVCFINQITDRIVSGQVQITSSDGAVAAASFAPPGVVTPL